MRHVIYDVIAGWLSFNGLLVLLLWMRGERIERLERIERERQEGWIG